MQITMALYHEHCNDDQMDPYQEQTRTKGLLTCSMVSTDVWAAGLALTGFRITASTAAWAAALAAAAAVA